MTDLRTQANIVLGLLKHSNFLAQLIIDAETATDYETCCVQAILLENKTEELKYFHCIRLGLWDITICFFRCHQAKLCIETGLESQNIDDIEENLLDIESHQSFAILNINMYIDKVLNVINNSDNLFHEYLFDHEAENEILKEDNYE